MFSATKFVVAGVIVALFGGFLLSGVLTQQGEESAPAVGASAPAHIEATVEATSAAERVTTTDILPGVDLVTEEVEPDVYRITSDGLPRSVLIGGLSQLLPGPLRQHRRRRPRRLGLVARARQLLPPRRGTYPCVAD